MESILGEHEGNKMSQMQSFGRWPSAGIQIELLPSLIRVENFIEIPVKYTHNLISQRVYVTHVQTGGATIFEQWDQYLETYLILLPIS